MKKTVYNILLIVTYIGGALLILSGLSQVAFDYESRRLDKYFLLWMHIALLMVTVLILVVHYWFLMWGNRKGILKKGSAIVLCVLDLWFYWFFFLSAVVGLRYGIENFIELCTNPVANLDNVGDLIFRTVSLMVPSLRVAFTLYILQKANN